MADPDAFDRRQLETVSAPEPEIVYARFFDITILNAEGEEVTPAEPVKVSIELLDAEQDELAIQNAGAAQVVHFGEMTELVEVELLEDTVAGVTFDAPGFSVYGVVYTVDFHTEINGKSFDYSIPGGGFVSFYELVKALGIAADDVDTEQDEIQALVDGVEKIEFSDPALVSVSKADTDNTVGAVKDASGLTGEYSAELTEEQIAEIDAQTVKAGDWALISLKPFLSIETLTVTMKTGDVFTVQVTDAQIKTQYLSDSGDLYEVTVIYDENAQIPEDASLKVTPIEEGSEAYANIRDLVLGTSEEEQAAALQALDISIIGPDGEEIEPKSTVRVELVVKNLAEELADAADSLSVMHLNASSGEIRVETVADKNVGILRVNDGMASASFTLDSFSEFAITYGTNNTTYVKVNVHYVDVNGNELPGNTDKVSHTINWRDSTFTDNLSVYVSRMSNQNYTYLSAHYGVYNGQVITSLKGSREQDKDSLADTNSYNYFVTFYNGDTIVARQEYESSLRQVDVYLVYAPKEGYYIKDTIGVDGCLTVQDGSGVLETGTNKNLFVRWYRSSNSTAGFQEVTQSKILNGNYNIPVLGGPKVNVSIDEGADQYYKAVIYKVENNQEVPVGETAVYHVPYYDDVRNGGFETPHNNGKTDESVNRWPSNWQVENGQNGVVWRTTGTANDGTRRDIEIPQGADANGRGANDIGDTLKNYCFAFMPEGNQCAELNCEASGALYQDVLTIPGSQIYWSLYHRARGAYDTWKTKTDKTQNRETDTMYVVAMSKELAEKYDVTTQEKVLKVLEGVNNPTSEFHDVEIVKITTTNQGDGKMTFMNSDYSMTVPETYFGNLANNQTNTVTVNIDNKDYNFKYGNTDWHYYTGNFSIPENQYLTRFFFVAGDTASNNPTMGNFLDDIKLSDSVPEPNHGQATAIIQKTVKGLDSLPENYATRIEAAYTVTSFNGITSDPIDRSSDYDLYRTEIDANGNAVSTASWTFPITVETGGSATFTFGQEVSPQTGGKTDQIAGYTQTTTWSISKNGNEVVKTGEGKVIPNDELEKLTIKEKDIVYIEFINTYTPKHKVSVWKTDPAGNVIPTGASFALYRADDFNDNTQMPKQDAEAIIEGTTGKNGILYLEELEEGEYRLVETKAPDGYDRLDSAITITVSKNGVTAIQGTTSYNIIAQEDNNWVVGQPNGTAQIQVWNNPGVELPSTGGPGTTLFTILGTGLSVGAGALLIGRKRTEY